MYNFLITYFSTDKSKLTSYWEKSKSWEWDIIWSIGTKPDNIWWAIELYSFDQKKILKKIELAKPMAIIQIKDWFICSDAFNNIIFLDSLLKITSIEKCNLLNSIHSIVKWKDDSNIILSSTWLDSVVICDINSISTWKILWTAQWSKYWLFPNWLSREINFLDDHSKASYPTLMQTTHLNSSFLDWDLLYVSLFHQWIMISVNLKTWKISELLKWMSCPHGIHKYNINGKDYFMISDTKHNKVFYDIEIDNNLVKTYKTLEDWFNWVQDTKYFPELSIISVLDSNNNRVVFYSYPNMNKISEYNFEKNNRVYDIILVNE